MPIDPATPPERQTAWEMALRGRKVRFRSLKTLDEFAPVERIERETLGFDDVDLLSASALLTVSVPPVTAPGWSTKLVKVRLLTELGSEVLMPLPT